MSFSPAALLLAMTVSAASVGLNYTEEAEAITEMPEAVRLEYTCDADAGSLTDGSYYSRIDVDEGLTVTLSEKAYAVYLIWRTPTACTIEYNGKKTELDDSFMHQFVELDGAETVTITPQSRFWPDIVPKLAELYFFSEGEISDDIQRWEPVLSRCDMLVLPTHSDDEVLMFGGTLPYYAGELGLRVQVAYMTHHWEEQPRPHELLDSLWACGVRNYPIIGVVPDIPCWTMPEAQAVFDEEEVLRFQVETIRRTKPSVIIGHDIDGEYGHGAHMMNAYTLQQAVEITADETQYPDIAEKYGVWDVQKTYLHFWKENAIQMDWEQPLSRFGGLTGKQAAAKAYLFHETQQHWGSSVNYAKGWDCRQYGLYRTLVGVDTTADFMENIIPLSEQEPEPPPEPTAEPTEEVKETSATQENVSSAPAAETEAPVVSQPEDSPAPEDDDKDNDSNVLLIVIAAVCGAAAVIVFAAVISSVIGRKKRKKKKYNSKRPRGGISGDRTFDRRTPDNRRPDDRRPKK